MAQEGQPVHNNTPAVSELGWMGATSHVLPGCRMIDLIKALANVVEDKPKLIQDWFVQCCHGEFAF